MTLSVEDADAVCHVGERRSNNFIGFTSSNFFLFEKQDRIVSRQTDRRL